MTEFNNNAKTTGGEYFYKCLKVLRDMGYEGELLFYPTSYDETLKKNCVSLYFYDQMIFANFDRKCTRISNSHQFSETEFMVMLLLDDNFLV